MSRTLLQISIGPVQGFISAARRTRDLWFGSHLISEISKAAAKAVLDTDGTLIFPSPLDSRDLDPGSDFNVANVILAEVADEAKAKAASDAARNAAEARWGTFVEEAHDVLRGRVAEDAWEYQRNGVIEFYSAWCPFGDESDYPVARQKVARLLAGRKNMRDFAPWQGRAGIPKSSLDGLRESVLKSRKGDEAMNIRGIRIKRNEALDLVGCVKRVAGQGVNDERRAFPSVTRIAVDPWIRGVGRKRSDKKEISLLYDKLLNLCKRLAESKVLSSCDSPLFPYEGTALLPQRYDELTEGLDNSEDIEKVKALRKERKELEDVVTKLHGLHKPMDPYLAVLVADGDRMGAAISTLKKWENHKEFSQTLSKFAGKAADIVKAHHGCCVYSGGDDVLAFLPLDTAIPCARDLHESFGSLWEEKRDWGFENDPTLSVGLAVGHALEDLEFLLKWGREAEKLAKEGSGTGKDDRNGLGITVRARGNSEMRVREQWEIAGNTGGDGNSLAGMQLDRRLAFWADRFARGDIPSKFPYDLRECVKVYEKWESKENLGEAIKVDVLRVFKRKEGHLKENDRKHIVDYIGNVLENSHRSIERLIDELLIAQWIGMARAAAGEV
jgi:CRISPR-associated protein Cmr2